MTQATGAPEPQAGPPAQPPLTGTTDPPAESGNEQISLDEARKLRQEAKALRARLAQFESDKTKRDEAELSAAEKATKRAEAAEARLAERDAQIAAARLEAAVTAAATALHIIDPEAARRLLDADDLVGADGTIDRKAVERALKDLVTRKPYLLAPDAGPAPRPTGGAGMAPGRAAVGGAGLYSRDQLHSMTPEQVAADYDRVMASMRALG